MILPFSTRNVYGQLGIPSRYFSGRFLLIAWPSIVKIITIITNCVLFLNKTVIYWKWNLGNEILLITKS